MVAPDSFDFQRAGVLQELAMVLGYMTRFVDDVALVVTYLLIYDSTVWTGRSERLAECALALLISHAVAPLFRFSRSWRVIRLRHELVPLLLFFTLSFTLTVCAFAALGNLPLDRAQQWVPAVVAWFSTGLLLTLLLRFSIRMGLRYIRAFGFDVRPAAFIGATVTARRLGDTFRHQPWMGIKIVGIFDDRPAERVGPWEDDDAELSGSIDDLEVRVRAGEVSNIYITLPMSAETRVQEIIRRFADTTASVYYSPPMGQLGLVGARWDEVYGQPVISIVESPFVGYSRALKRLEDVVLLGLLLPMALPIMAVIAPLVRLTSKGPILYRQSRLGVDGKPFVVFKFRTMYVAERDAAFIQARRGDPRVTALGRFLRRTSLDELPQVFNVLNGTMSVVGPRPHPLKLNEDFRGSVPQYMVRHKVKPGITGLAQVNGARGETDTIEKMERRVSYDLMYIRRWSLWLDMQILARTLLVPILDRGAY